MGKEHLAKPTLFTTGRFPLNVQMYSIRTDLEGWCANITLILNHIGIDQDIRVPTAQGKQGKGP